MNAKNKKLLAIVGVAAVLLIVIGVSVSMLGKSSQPSGTDPAAAPTDVTTEDVSQPPEEETTTPTVEVPDVSAPENTPTQEQADPVLDVEQEDQVDVDLTDSEKKPESTPPPAPSPEEQQAASENNEPIVSDPAANQPQNGDTQDGSIQRLLSIGVVNLITAETLEDAADELKEALSDEGMQRYVTPMPVSSQPEPQWEPAPEPEAEIIPYRWNAKNIRIAVAGTQRRSGVTVTAFNLAAWLTARGAEVAYIEVNTNRHLQLLLNVYEAAPTGEHYTIDGIDCYLTNEPDREYQFIIYDCGVMQAPTSVFREADHRLLCGSVLPYEIPAFHKALEICGGLEVRPVAISVPGEFREYCRELFGGEMEMAEASHNLFAERTNGRLYKRLVEPYIMGERRL